VSSPPAADVSVDLLPHRPPFRFVDEVADHEPGRSITARYRVTGEEPFLAGHFPGNPVFPGVLQLEAMAQAGAILVIADLDRAGALPLFGGVEDARFRRLVRPGDTLELTVEMERLTARGGWGRGEARVGDAVAGQARMLFVIERPEGP
jgi:3-hydroxyacyl-[acyl-carrier-protein] dehydratase